MIPDFSNSVILPENLPSIEQAEFNPIDSKYRKVLYFNHFLTGLIAGLSIVGFFLISRGAFPAILLWGSVGLLAALEVFSVVLTNASFPKRGYLIREKDIAYQRGLIRYKLTSIPFNRIQHVELIQTVVAKRLGLATIKVYTAGSSADDLVIPGLPLDTATRIREFLTAKISADEQE